MNEYLNKVSNPSQAINRGSTEGMVQPSAPGPNSNKKMKKPRLNFSVKRLGFVLFIFVLAVIVSGIIFLVIRSSGTATATKINTKEYQAVFLNSSDGQVYFGKLSSLNSQYYMLTDIYYVRVQQVQPGAAKTDTSSNISLVKLGNEIHGPEDAMYINKNNVMFWENLKSSGQVVKAIQQYQANQAKDTAK